MQLSQLIGTMLLSPEGEQLGYVKDARITRDARAVSCLIGVDGEEEEFIVPARAVLAAKDAAIIGRARLTSPIGTATPMGRAVFSEKGEYLGTVSDMRLAEKPAIFVSLEGVTQEIPLTRAALGETVIVFAEEKKKRPPVRKAQKQAETPPPAEEAPEQREETASKAAFAFNRYNLLGRRVKKSVFDAYGIPVALAGERVTPEMLATARKRNRLLALTVNTLTNVL